MTTITKVKPAALAGNVMPERAIKGALTPQTWKRLSEVWRSSHPTKEWCFRLYQYISEVMPCPAVRSITMLEYLLREGVEAFALCGADAGDPDRPNCGHRAFMMAVVAHLPALLDMYVFIELDDKAAEGSPIRGRCWDATLGSVLDWARDHRATELCVEFRPINAEYARPARNGISLVLAGASQLMCRRDIVKFDYPSLGNQYLFFSRVEFGE